MLVFCRLTIPCIKHVCNEVVYKGNLGLWDATCVPVKHGHNHRQTLPLLLIRLHQRQEQMNEFQINCLLTKQSNAVQFHFTCAKYSSEMRPAHSIQSSWGLHGLEISAHLISIRLTRIRFSGDVRILLTDSSSLLPWNQTKKEKISIKKTTTSNIYWKQSPWNAKAKLPSEILKKKKN